MIDAVCAVIPEISFKGAGVASEPSTLEARIVQDADRLDAIGAIGIAAPSHLAGMPDSSFTIPIVLLSCTRTSRRTSPLRARL